MPQSCKLVVRLCLVVCLATSAALAQGEVAAPGAASSSTLTIDGLGKGTAALDGPWQFHLGDNAAWAAPGLDDSGWERITADKPWGAQSEPGYTGFAWYRRRISITPAPGASPDLALMVPAIDDNYELYWNGALVGGNGKLPPHPVWYPFEPPQTFGLGPVRSGVLAVRVWKSPLGSNDPNELGGFEGLPVVGSPEGIANLKADTDFRWLRARQIDFALTALYLLVAVTSLLTWLRDRKQWLLFWMAGYSLSPAIAQMLTGLRLPLSGAWAQGLLQPVFMVQDVSLWFVLLWLLKLQEDRRMQRFTQIAAMVFCMAFTLDGVVEVFWGWYAPRALQIIDGALTAIFTPLELVPIVVVIVAVRKRSQLDSARWTVAICAFISEMIFVIRNATSQGVRFTHLTISDALSAPLFRLVGNSITARLLGNVLLLISIGYAVWRYAAEERKRRNMLAQEFRNARELQQVLIPETLPLLPGFHVTSAYRPAQEVGGDFFQFIPVGKGSTLVIVGDVSGKGLKAAMAVSLIVGAARMVAEYTSSPAEVLAGLNRRLHNRLQGGFATCLAMRLDPDGACTIASAGHPAPFLNDDEFYMAGALPLGLAADTTYEETAFSLHAGDHFALYTDGLLEARNKAGELYSFGRLQDLFRHRPNAAEATEAAVNFGQDDDITVVTLTRLATGKQSTALHSVPRI